jgi:outer membrane immunogenic protein
MRIILTTTAAAALLLGTSIASNAADLPRRAPVTAPAMVAPIYNWTGFYIGINGGGGWGTSKWDSVNSVDTAGALVGGTIGYNIQFGSWVLGIEGDGGWSSIGGTSTAGCGTGCTSKNSWLSTVRGRVGYAFDRWMPYATGGGVFGDVHASRPGFTGVTSTQAGWTVGGGLEFAVAGNWTAKIEYLYADLGSFNCGLNCGVLATTNVDFKANIVRGGINFRF